MTVVEATTKFTTTQAVCQAPEITTAYDMAEQLYREYINAYGYAVDAQCEDFDTSSLFGAAYAIGGMLNAHLERAFGLSRDAQESFWDFMKVGGFGVSEAIERLVEEHEARDEKRTIMAAMYAGCN